MTVAVVVGNPKPASRTLDAAIAVATRLGDEPPQLVIDVVTLGAGLLEANDAAITDAVAAVSRSDVAVFASPTYKASFTGLLKLFLDRFPAGGLERVVAFPLMLGGHWGHALAPEVFLRPVLVELGASVPAPGLFLLDSDYEDTPSLTTWLQRARRSL